MLGFVAMNADRVVLGGLIDTPTFGLYAIACLLAGAVQAVIGNLLGNVVYPALSEVARQAPGRVLATLERFQILFDRAVVTGAGFLAMTGPLIVGLLYDPRYAPAGWMLSALAIGLIGLRSQVVEQAYLPLGKPQVMTLTMALRAVGLVLASSLGYRWGGLEMAVYGIAACTFLTWPVALWFKAGLGRLNWRLELHFLPFALLGGVLGWASSAGFALLRH
jgi:O-antigen/teichoic acid export membrane protein